MASDSATTETLIGHQSRLSHTPWHSNNDLLHVPKKISSLEQSSTSSETSTPTDSQSIDNSNIHISDKHFNGENEIGNFTETNKDDNKLPLLLNQIFINDTTSNDDDDDDDDAKQEEEEASSDILTKSYKNDSTFDFTSMSDNVKQEQIKIQDNSLLTNCDNQQQQQQNYTDQDESEEVSKIVKRITKETEQSELQQQQQPPALTSAFLPFDNSNGGSAGDSSPKQLAQQDLSSSSSSSTSSYDNGTNTSIDIINSFIQSTSTVLARTLSNSNNSTPTTAANGSSSIYLHTRNSSKTLKCPKCNWHYKYQETLEIHMKEKHPDQETSCLYCLSSQLHPRLARGESYSCGYKPYRCEICNYSTTTKGNLSIHMQSDKHMNNIRECQQQTNSFISTISSTNSSETHLQDTTNSSPPLIQPPSLLTEDYSTFGSQISSTKQSSLFRCDSCNYETNIGRNLRIHMNSDKHIQNSQQKAIKNENSTTTTITTNEENDKRSDEKEVNEISQPREDVNVDENDDDKIEEKNNINVKHENESILVKPTNDIEEKSIELERTLTSPLSCPLCSESISSVDLMKHHLCTIHNCSTSAINRCMSLLGIDFNSITMRTTAKDVSDSCQLKCVPDDIVNSESTTNSNVNNLDYRCHSCSKNFKDIEQLCEHFKESNHLDFIDSSSILCWKKGCNQYFSSLPILSIHFREIHSSLLKNKSLLDDLFSTTRISPLSSISSSSLTSPSLTQSIVPLLEHQQQLSLENETLKLKENSPQILPYYISTTSNLPNDLKQIHEHQSNQSKQQQQHTSDIPLTLSTPIIDENKYSSTCIKCSKRFSRKSDFDMHMKLCNEQSSTSKSRKLKPSSKHQKSRQPEQQNTLLSTGDSFISLTGNKCDLCDIDLSSSTDLNTHAQSLLHQTNLRDYFTSTLLSSITATAAHTNTYCMPEFAQQWLKYFTDTNGGNSSSTNDSLYDPLKLWPSSNLISFDTSSDTTTTTTPLLDLSTKKQVQQYKPSTLTSQSTASIGSTFSILTAHSNTTTSTTALASNNNYNNRDTLPPTPSTPSSPIPSLSTSTSSLTKSLSATSNLKSKQAAISIGTDIVKHYIENNLAERRLKREQLKENQSQTQSQMSALTKSQSFEGLASFLKPQPVVDDQQPIKNILETTNTANSSTTTTTTTADVQNIIDNTHDDSAHQQLLTCDLCSKTFSTLTILKVHYEQCHHIQLSSTAIEHWLFLLQKLHDLTNQQTTITTQSTSPITPMDISSESYTLTPTSPTPISIIDQTSKSPLKRELSQTPILNSSSTTTNQNADEQQERKKLRGMGDENAQHLFDRQMAVAAQAAINNIYPPLFVPQTSQRDSSTSNSGTTVITTPLTPSYTHSSSTASTANKRIRTRITDDQLKILRQHFNINNSPSDEQVMSMSSKTGLTAKVVKHWFRNTLFKERQRNKDSPYNFNNPPAQTKIDLEEYHKTGTIVKKDQDIQEQDISQKHDEQMHSEVSDDDLSSINDDDDDDSLTYDNTSLLPTAESDNDEQMQQSLSMNLTSPTVKNSQQQQQAVLCAAAAAAAAAAQKRANRTRFTDFQLKSLQESFEQNPYPKDDDLEVLSERLKLNSRVIVVWFQNARQKARKSYENQFNTSGSAVISTNDQSSTIKLERDDGYTCKYCQKLFQRFAELMKHMKQCNNTTYSSSSSTNVADTNNNNNNSEGTQKINKQISQATILPKTIKPKEKHNIEMKSSSTSIPTSIISPKTPSLLTQSVQSQQFDVSTHSSSGRHSFSNVKRESAFHFDTDKSSSRSKQSVLNSSRSTPTTSATTAIKSEPSDTSPSQQFLKATLDQQFQDPMTASYNMFMAAAAAAAAVQAQQNGTTSYNPFIPQSMSTTSSSGKENYCDQCDKTFSSLAEFQEHQSLHMAMLNAATFFPLYHPAAAAAAAAAAMSFGNFPGSFPAPPPPPHLLLPSTASSSVSDTSTTNVITTPTTPVPNLSEKTSKSSVRDRDQLTPPLQSSSSKRRSTPTATAISFPTITNSTTSHQSSMSGCDDDSDVDGQDSHDSSLNLNSSNNAAMNGNSKRNRTTILPEQQDYLMQKYQLESNPSRKMLEEISTDVGLKKRVVQVWFQNTRARERKGTIKTAISTTSSTSNVQQSQIINKRCLYCPYTFKLRSTLENHLILKHQDQLGIEQQHRDQIKFIDIDTFPDATPASTPTLTTPNPPMTTVTTGGIFVPPSMNEQEEIEDQESDDNFEEDDAMLQGENNADDAPLDLTKPLDLVKQKKTVVKSCMNEKKQQHRNDLMSSYTNNISLTTNDELTNNSLDYSDNECGTQSDYDTDTDFGSSQFQLTTSHPGQSLLNSNKTPYSSNSQSWMQRQSSSQTNLLLSPHDNGGLHSPTDSTHNGNGSSKDSNGQRRFRTQMTPLQIKLMKAIFLEYRTPTMPECELLGRQINLQKRVVQVWFQNARAKEKKNPNFFKADLDLTYERSQDECRLCSTKYTLAHAQRDHLFTSAHIENVRSLLCKQVQNSNSSCTSHSHPSSQQLLSSSMSSSSSTTNNNNNNNNNHSEPLLDDSTSTLTTSSLLNGLSTNKSRSSSLFNLENNINSTSDNNHIDDHRSSSSSHSRSLISDIKTKEKKKSTSNSTKPTTKENTTKPIEQSPTTPTIDQQQQQLMAAAAAAGLMGTSNPSMLSYLNLMMPHLMPMSIDPYNFSLVDPTIHGTHIFMLQLPAEAIQNIMHAIKENQTTSQYTQDGKTRNDLTSLDHKISDYEIIDVGFACRHCNFVWPLYEPCRCHTLLCSQLMPNQLPLTLQTKQDTQKMSRYILKIEQLLYRCTVCHSSYPTVVEFQQHTKETIHLKNMQNSLNNNSKRRTSSTYSENDSNKHHQKKFNQMKKSTTHNHHHQQQQSMTVTPTP